MAPELADSKNLLPRGMDAPSSSHRRYSRRAGRENFVRRVILPAIHGRTCPICLDTISSRQATVITSCKHAFCSVCIRTWSSFKRICPLCNARFDSWFRDVDLSSGRFLCEKLPPFRQEKSFDCQYGQYRRRIIRRSREELNGTNLRSRPLPWQRFFRRPGEVSIHARAENKLQWRASVYDRKLQAVPMPSRIRLEQGTQWTDHRKEKILQRIEPWIRRDLRAILGDIDPSVIVHLASSIFITSLERRFNFPSGQACIQDDISTPLRRFLHEKTDMFLHELRCFAESSLNMDAYDEVVEYRQ